ncbi:MAG: hypothetical protein MOB07_31465 [Acidobacteria bacterium]|nr:hypothetical protein [Acidobacteriota bacterium]
MRTQIQPEEAAGKTIDKIVISQSEHALIMLTDGSYLYGQPEHYYESLIICFKEPFDMLSFGEDSLIEAGFATLEEIETEREKRAHASNELREANERALYERLKARFESGGR